MLGRLDVIAGQPEARATLIRFALAESPETMVKQGWATQPDFPDGLERDPYDDEAILVMGWHDETLAAGDFAPEFERGDEVRTASSVATGHVRSGDVRPARSGR